MKSVKGIKKVAALGLGLAMLGATVAMAYDLGDYPEPFVKDGEVNAKLVLGEKAKVIDVLGAVNIAASLSAAGGAGTVVIESTEGSVANAIPFDEWDKNANSVDEFPAKGEYRRLKFDEDDSEWAHLVGYNNEDITEDMNITVYATKGDDDCDPDEVIQIEKFEYNITYATDELDDYFDDLEDELQDENSTDFDFTITLFGKEYKVHIDDIDNASDTYTDAETGYGTDTTKTPELQIANADLYLHTGDEVDLSSYGYPGYKLVVEDMYEESSSSQSNNGYVTISLVDENGLTVDTETIEENGYGYLKDTDNDISIKLNVDNVYWSAEKAKYTAKVYFESGKLRAGDYLDTKKMWQVKKIEVDGSNKKIKLIIALDPEDKDKFEEECKIEYEDNKVWLYPGNQVGIEDYINVGFVGLTEQTFGAFKLEQTDTNPEKYKLSFSGVKDLTLGNQETKATELTFEWDSDNRTLNLTGMSGDDYDDFEGFYLYNTTGHTITFSVGDTDYTLKFYNTTNNRRFILSADFETGSFDENLTIKVDNDGDYEWDLTYVDGTNGDYLEGDSSDSGIKVEEYDKADRVVEFKLPDDVVRYKVYAGRNVLGEEKATYSFSVGDTVNVVGKVKSVGGTPLPVGLAILDTELPGSVKDGNYIVVGGPCVNTAAAELLGNPANCAEGFEPGKAIIKLFDNNGKYALLVAGYSGQDTLAATEMLGRYDLYKEDFEGKTEVTVSTATKTVVNVEEETTTPETTGNQTTTE